MRILELELQATGQAEQTSALQQAFGDKDIPIQDILHGTVGGNPSTYATELSQLQTWVDGSLDTYKVS